MLNLERHEKNAIRLAQRKTKMFKGNGRKVSCPFVHTIDSLRKTFLLDNVSKEVCMLCHRWMGTNFKDDSHPCNQIRTSVIKERFWRNPDHEYPILK